MKLLISFILSFGFLASYSQTTPLVFTPSAANPDIENYGRGAEQWIGAPWDNTNDPYIPAGNSTPLNRYYRFNWKDIESNTVQGSYSWTLFDAQINAAIDAGQMFSFGVMPMCTACGSGGVYPDYLHTLMQAETTNSQDWFYSAGGFWVPNWNSPNYLGRYQALLQAIAAHIATGTHSGKNYKDVIYYVDIRGYGDFGEWHTYPWYTTGNLGTVPTGRIATSATLKAIIDMNLSAFPSYPNTIIMGAFDGGNASVTPADVTYYALTKTNAWGQIGWRRDNYGDAGYDAALANNPGTYNPGTGSVSFSTLIRNKYKFAPVVGEPSNDGTAVSTGSGCPTYYCDLTREVTLYGTTSFGNGNLPTAASGNAAMVTNLIAASRAAGYRLLLTGGSMTTNLAIGSQFNVTLNWQNIGAAPTYENWNVVYQLRNSGGTTVASWTSAFNPKLFIPSATSTSESDNFTVPSIATGSNYSLYVKVVDPLGYKTPLQLAITGQGGDGAYLVRGGIVVGAGGPPFRVNAGADQTKTTGTTTATLSGVLPADTSTLLIIWGESNASGHAFNSSASTAEKANRSNIKWWNHSTQIFEPLHVGVNNEQDNDGGTSSEHGPELWFANLVDSGWFAAPLYIDKTGASGSYICQWLPGTGIVCRPTGGLWENWILPFVDSAVGAMNALGKPYRIVVWSSIGLNDRYNQGTTPANFLSSNATFRSAFRTRYGSNIHFLYTDFNNPPSQSFDWSYLFTQMAASDPMVHSIPVTGSTYIDGGVHWDYNGFKMIDKNMKDTMLNSPGLQIGIGGPYTVAWSKVSGPNSPTITSPTSKTTGITGLIDGTYVFRMSVTDSLGTVQTDDMTLTIGGGSAVGPTAIISPAGPITLPTSSVTLTSASTDDNGTISTYAWANVSGPNAPTIVSGSSSSTSVTGLVQGTYVFRLTITDNHSLQSTTTTSVVVNPQPASGINIFTTQVPAHATGNDGNQGGLTGIETGVKFRSSQSGYITGVRYYRTAGNNGTHVGELYTKAGSRLASATFDGADTSIGWHSVAFGSPQAILANTTYVAAYFNSSGYYVVDNSTSSSGALTAAITNAPLTALADGTDGGNGLYDYANAARLPTLTFKSSNYYIDVVFTQNLAPNPVIFSPAGSTVTLPTSQIFLDGSQSTDADGTISTYAWSQVSGPNTATIGTSSATSSTITGLIQGIYTFRLTITDNLGSIGTIDKIINVVYQTPAGKIYHRKTAFIYWK